MRLSTAPSSPLDPQDRREERWLLVGRKLQKCKMALHSSLTQANVSGHDLEICYLDIPANRNSRSLVLLISANGYGNEGRPILLRQPLVELRFRVLS